MDEFGGLTKSESEFIVRHILDNYKINDEDDFYDKITTGFSYYTNYIEALEDDIVGNDYNIGEIINDMINFMSQKVEQEDVGKNIGAIRLGQYRYISIPNSEKWFWINE
jgi:hypothetical protein